MPRSRTVICVVLSATAGVDAVASRSALLSSPSRMPTAAIGRQPLSFAPRMCSEKEPDFWRPARVNAEALSVGQVAPCTILSEKEDRSYVVDLGTAKPAILPAQDAALLPKVPGNENRTAGQGWTQLEAGEVYEAEIRSIDGEDITVSIATAQRAFAWQRIGQLLEEDFTVPATVIKLGAAGATVSVEGIPGLLPWSHWSPSDEERKAGKLTGSQVWVKFLEADQARERLVVSARRVLIEERLSELEPGQLVEGKVHSVRDFGVLVQIADGLDGLLHISQLSKNYVKGNLTQILPVGTAVTAIVLKADAIEGTIKLSTKMLEPKPGAILKDAAAVFASARAAAAVARESMPPAEEEAEGGSQEKNWEVEIEIPDFS